MSGVRRPGLESRAGAAWTAVLVLVAVALIQLASASCLSAGRAVLGGLCALDGGLVAVGLLLVLLVPWERLPRPTLLVFPAVLIGALDATARLAPHISPAYAPLLMTPFVIVGLTQRRGVSLAVVGPAAACWLDMQECAISGQLAVRLVVTVCVWVVVTELLAWTMAVHRRAHDRLLRAADHDPLTGLGNRRALDLVHHSGEPGGALVMIDLDHFKEVNDTYGHLEGDRVLADFAHVLVTELRAGDEVYRYGGEEFLLVARSTGALGAAGVLERTRRAWSAVRPDISFSAGIADWAGDEAGAVALARADAALYRAKDAGRDCWRVDTDMMSGARVLEHLI